MESNHALKPPRTAYMNVGALKDNTGMLNTNGLPRHLVGPYRAKGIKALSPNYGGEVTTSTER